MRELTRRDALAGATALGAVMLAGCVADEEDDTETGAAGGEGSNGDDNDVTGSPAAETDGETDDTASEQRNRDGRETDGDEPTGSDTGDGSGGEDADGEESTGSDTGDSSGEDTDDSERSENGDGSDTGDGEDDTLDGQEIVLDYTVETTSTGCTAEQIGSRRAELVSQADGTVTVEGYVVTSTPCHEAQVQSVRYRDGGLTLSVATQSNLGPKEACVQCLGEISYEAVISVAEGTTVESVSVASDDRISGPG